MKLVQFDFPFDGPFGDDMAAALAGLALSINDEPGFLWKIWTENAVTSEVGGIYLFADETSALAYVEKHVARLAHLGVRQVNAKLFDVNGPLTMITHGPVPAEIVQ
jgi:hypothetical protein